MISALRVETDLFIQFITYRMQSVISIDDTASMNAKSVNKVDDLRGLGIHHRQAVLQK